MQIGRAFLSMLSGRQRELRLVRSVESEGQRLEVPVRGKSERFLDPAVIEAYLGRSQSKNREHSK